MSEHRASRNLAVVALASAVAMTTASAWGSYKGNFYIPAASSSQGLTNHSAVMPTLGLPSDIDDISFEGTQALKTWNNAAGGPWGTAGNWTGGVPAAADNALFNLNNTYTVTVPAGAVANDVRVAAGNVTLTGGTLTTAATANPGVGPATATPAGTSLIVAGSAQLTISGGQTFNYLQGYVGEAIGNTGTLTVTGANTLLTTTSANAAANGRFGTLSGNTTINVTAGGRVDARLFEFGRQDGNYNMTVNVNGGTLGTITANPVLDPESYAQIVLPRGIGATMNMNVTNLGQVNVATLFSGAIDPAISTTGNLSVNSAGSTMRVNNVAVVNGGNQEAGYNASTNFNVTAGTLSIGRINSNQDGGIENNLASSNATYNVNGSTAKLEVKDSNGIDSSYIVMGFGAWSTDTLNVTNGGDVVVTDTGTTENDFAFMSLTNASHTRSTVTVDGNGSTITVDDEFDVGGVGQDTLTGLYGEDAVGVVNVRNGGNITVVDGNSFWSVDPGNSSTLNVESGGSYVINGQWTLGGGNATDFEGVGSGNSAVNILTGGSATAGHIIVGQDDGDASLPIAQTSILVNGTNSHLLLNGDDDPFTEGLDSGFIATGGTFSNTDVAVVGGGTLTARFIANFGESDDSTTSVTVAGANSVLDAGGQFALGGGNNTTASLTVADGGLVKTVINDDTVDLSSSMFFGTTAGTNSTVTVNLNGNNSALDSAIVIWVGGTFGGDPAELTLGVPTTITGQAGTQIRYGAELYLAPNSSITTAGTFQYTGLLSDGGGTFFDGPATINGAGVSHMGWLGIDNTDATFNGKLTMNAATGHAVAAVSRLELSGGGKVDLRKSDAIVIHPTTFGTEPDTIPAQTLADIKPLIVAGYAGGTWNPTDTTDAIYGGDIAGQNPKRGIGYRVATAAGDFLGETIAVGDILVRNTLLGDSNLDGSVNFNDLLALAQNYNTANPANREWYHGNFNYDNAVNFDDLLVTAQNYNGVLTLDGEATDGWGMTEGFMAEWTHAQSLVPEPTTLGLLAGAGLMALRRRRR